MKTLSLITSSLLLACSGAHSAPPTATSTEKPAETPNALDAAVKERIEPLVRDQWAGAVSVAMIDRAGTRFVHAGPADESTLFEIGSVTKTFTSLALATLVEDGAVTLDTDVESLLGSKVPAKDGRKITLVDLATHTSGLPRLPTNFAPKNAEDPYADYDEAKLRAFLESYELGRRPGDKYEYSNVGAGLLGFSLAKKQGVTYEALVRTRVLEPLGMTSTFVDPPASQTLAVGHDGDGNEVKPWNLATLVGAGGLKSNARDMARYVRAQLGLDKTKIDRAIASTHVRRHDADKGAVALAWHIDESGAIWHNGQTGGAHSFVGFDVQKGIGVVVLASGAVSAVDPIGRELLAIARGEAASRTPLPTTLSLDATTLASYVGTYRLAPSFAIVVTRDGDRLFGQATGQPRFRLWAEAPDSFYLRVVDAKISFTRSAGKVDGLVLHQGGKDMPGKRE